MHRARDLQRACPRSQAWLRQALESGLVGFEAKTSARQFARQKPTQRPSTTIQPFSSSRAVRNDAQPSNDAPKSTPPPVDIETVVRQARATFGDTLPKDFLSEAELKLYERLFGSPIRETRPEDVGLPLAERELNAAKKAEPAKNLLFREVEGGLLEEVSWKEKMVPRDAEVDAEADAEGGTTLMEDLLTPAHIQYIQASARNEREYHALTKLQRDFVVAQRQAELEEKAEQAAEQALLDRQEEELLKAERAKYIIEEEYLAEEEEEDEFDEEDALDARGNQVPRVHPLTMAFRSRTQPSTIQLPKAEFVEPISELLKRTDIKHVRLAAQKAFGGRDLPYSPRSPASTPGGKGGNYAQRPVAMEPGHHRMSDIDADAYMATVLPAVYATAMSTLVEVRRRLGSGWIEGLLSKPDGNPRILDVGGGGAALAAWNQVFRSELERIREKGHVPGQLFEGDDDAAAAERAGILLEKDDPIRKGSRRRMERTVVVGSDALRHRLSRFLYNTTFLPRLPDLLHSAENVERHIDAPESPNPDGTGRRKTYDVILASHALMPLDKPYQRRQFIDNLWAMLNPNGGVIIFVEKGHPRGFEAVAGARQRILDRFIVPPVQEGNPAPAEGAATEEIFPEDTEEDLRRPKEPGMIVAPCTNHNKCPMYLTPGISPGRKDFCHFSQRFNRPPFLQRILGQTHHNHEDLDYCYVAVQRGTGVSPTPTPIQGQTAANAAFAGFEGASDNGIPHPLALPRTILPPLKRHGHVILDVCTPAGQLERWTVPKSRGKQAYHDARKLRWGDLWALGAKTRVPRPVRLGKGGPDGKKPKERTIDVKAVNGQIVSATEGGNSTRADDRPPILKMRDRKKYGKGGLKKRSRRAEAQSIMDELKKSVLEAP
ncbi:37S ribosomal protein S22 [Sporothrix eucalyptigena]|uniref:37S ribosomal protein S22 n=1 Tax=Sporothrix eucalyptigena TaxID=1812306 RepID=A0ABP0BS04_9PEZI